MNNPEPLPNGWCVKHTRPYIGSYCPNCEKDKITQTSVAEQRKQVPMYSGLLKYFPNALAAVSHLSWVGNEQHNPGEPLHWSKEKSSDHEDCLMRHLKDHVVMRNLKDHVVSPVDSDGELHLTKVAWRALAALETYLDNEHGKEKPEVRT